MKGLAVETYGLIREGLDPARQALHFVATASTYCLVPEEMRLRRCKKNIGWAVAMHTRMARCLGDMALDEEGEDFEEEEAQYGISSESIGKLRS